jgi:hypothetical protein
MTAEKWWRARSPDHRWGQPPPALRGPQDRRVLISAMRPRLSLKTASLYTSAIKATGLAAIAAGLALADKAVGSF